MAGALVAVGERVGVRVVEQSVVSVAPWKPLEEHKVFIYLFLFRFDGERICKLTLVRIRRCG